MQKMHNFKLKVNFLFRTFRNHFFCEKHVFLTEIIKILRSKVTK